MDRRATQAVALRFQAYIEHLSGVIGHADRREPLAAYCTGLLLPGERKIVEPMAALIAPGDEDAVGARHGGGRCLLKSPIGHSGGHDIAPALLDREWHVLRHIGSGVIAAAPSIVVRAETPAAIRKHAAYPE
jgi:hypothetical protein